MSGRKMQILRRYAPQDEPSRLRAVILSNAKD
jgi:hypothetical protein